MILSGCSGTRGGLIRALKPPAGSDFDKSSSNDAKGLTGGRESEPTGEASTMSTSFEERDVLIGGRVGTGFERDARSGDCAIGRDGALDPMKSFLALTGTTAGLYTNNAHTRKTNENDIYERDAGKQNAQVRPSAEEASHKRN